MAMNIAKVVPEVSIKPCGTDRTNSHTKVRPWCLISSLSSIPSFREYGVTAENRSDSQFAREFQATFWVVTLPITLYEYLPHTQIFLQRMYPTIPTFLLIGLLSSILASCATSKKENQKPIEPIKKPEITKPLPKTPSDPTAGWRGLNDTKLPTPDQLADGAESSIGGITPNSPSNDGPSTSIKPPRSMPEDQLAPSE